MDYSIVFAFITMIMLVVLAISMIALLFVAIRAIYRTTKEKVWERKVKREIAEMLNHN